MAERQRVEEWVRVAMDVETRNLTRRLAAELSVPMHEALRLAVREALLTVLTQRRKAEGLG